MHINPEVAAAGDKGLALRMEGGRVDSVPVGLDDAQRKLLEALVRGCVPKGDLGARGDREGLLVARDFNRVDRAVKRQLRDLRERAHIPEPQRLIVARREEHLARRRGQVAHDLDGLVRLMA